MISAMDRNRVIGTREGGIPWHLPRDIERFRKFTDRKVLLLGRRTFEEMSGWFTNQTPIILSHDPDFRPGFGSLVGHVEAAISEAAALGAAELAVCGGASVYETALPYADELFLTLIDATVAGSVLFPDYEDGIEWEELSRETYPADGENEFAMTFLRLRRSQPASLRPARLHLL